MSKPKFTPDQLAFIDEFVGLLAPRGMPPSVGRLYGYLMLVIEPVSLDDMAEDLNMAKSSASVAARLLESASLVCRHTVSGSKRVLYTLSDNPASLLAEQSRSLQQLGELLKRQAPVVATGAVQARIEMMASFYATMQKVLAQAVTDWAQSTSAPDNQR